jgi:hypothetical protein
MTVSSDNTPWTWEQIARFTLEERKAFIREYGPTGIVAIMAAGHPPRTWANCDLKQAANVACFQCPLDGSGKWRKGLPGSCSVRAMEVYTRMVEELGRLPVEE